MENLKSKEQFEVVKINLQVYPLPGTDILQVHFVSSEFQLKM
jgi:hypothetical protein